MLRGATLRFLVRRAAQAVPMLLVVVLVNFFLLRLAPGDIVDVLAGEAGSAAPEVLEALRRQYGLDRGVLDQLLAYVTQVAQLDLGMSHRHGVPVAQLILGRLGPTLLLILSSIVLSVALGVLLGIVAAHWRGRAVDNVISTLTTLGFATPLFWMGLMLVVLFSIRLRWLPASGVETIGAGLQGAARGADVLLHLVLPAVTLSLFYTAIYVRLMRAAMLEVAGLDFVRTARAKGASAFRVLWHHQFRNALLPIVTMTGLQLGSLFGGAVVVETVFGWPGLGRLAFDAIFQRDLNLLLGILLASSALVLALNLAVDLLYAFLDPRIELR